MLFYANLKVFVIFANFVANVIDFWLTSKLLFFSNLHSSFFFLLIWQRCSTAVSWRIRSLATFLSSTSSNILCYWKKYSTQHPVHPVSFLVGFHKPPAPKAYSCSVLFVVAVSSSAPTMFCSFVLPTLHAMFTQVWCPEIK